MLNALTRALYQAARLSNKARIAGQLFRGNPKPLLRHERNRLYFRIFGRFLK